MALNLRTPLTFPAAISSTTARFDLRSAATAVAVGGGIAPSTSSRPAPVLVDAADGGLGSATDGLLLPVVLALISLIGAALIVAMIRRRSQRRPASETAESEAPSAGGLASTSGRDRNLPRWLDPSIAAARFRTDTTTAVRTAAAMVATPARTPLVFAGPIDELVDRARVRYDAVPLLDRPDDVLGQTQGELDAEDEVEVLERSEIWARIRTPNGTTGWLPGMTLSMQTAVAAPSAEEVPVVGPPARPVTPVQADEPSELESILAAILAQRRAHPEPPATMPVEPPSTAVEPIVGVDVPSVAPKRTRVRKPEGERPAATQSAPRRTARVADRLPPDPVEPAPIAPAPIALDPLPAAPKRRRPRPPAAERKAARPS
jgi:hypothetical protein